MDADGFPLVDPLRPLPPPVILPVTTHPQFAQMRLNNTRDPRLQNTRGRFPRNVMDMILNYSGLTANPNQAHTRTLGRWAQVSVATRAAAEPRLYRLDMEFRHSRAMVHGAKTGNVACMARAFVFWDTQFGDCLNDPRPSRGFVGKAWTWQASTVSYGAPLHIAAREGRTKAIEWLLEHGARPRSLWSWMLCDTTSVGSPCRGRHDISSDAVLAEPPGRVHKTPLQLAFCRQNPDPLRYQASIRCLIRADQYSGSYRADSAPNSLDNSLNLNQPINPNVYSSMGNGRTVVHDAVQNMDVVAIDNLAIYLTTDVNVLDGNGETPLCDACTRYVSGGAARRRRSEIVVAKLLKLGAEFNNADRAAIAAPGTGQGDAVAYAEAGHWAAVAMLIRLGRVPHDDPEVALRFMLRDDRRWAALPAGGGRPPPGPDMVESVDLYVKECIRNSNEGARSVLPTLIAANSTDLVGPHLINAVRYFLDKGADVNAPDSENETPISRAIAAFRRAVEARESNIGWLDDVEPEPADRDPDGVDLDEVRDNDNPDEIPDGNGGDDFLKLFRLLVQRGADLRTHIGTNDKTPLQAIMSMPLNMRNLQCMRSVVSVLVRNAQPGMISEKQRKAATAWVIRRLAPARRRRRR